MRYFTFLLALESAAQPMCNQERGMHIIKISDVFGLDQRHACYENKSNNHFVGQHKPGSTDHLSVAGPGFKKWVFEILSSTKILFESSKYKLAA